jgi:hypothetical protein
MEGVRARRGLDHGDRAPPAVGAMANRRQTIIALAGGQVAERLARYCRGVWPN